MTFLGKNFHFNIQKSFFSHRLYFLCLLPVSTVRNLTCNKYDPFLDQRTSISEKILPWDHFFSQFVLCLTSNNSTSRNIEGGRMHGPSPTSNFVRGRPLSSPTKSPPVHEGIFTEIVRWFRQYSSCRVSTYPSCSFDGTEGDWIKRFLICNY